MNVTYLKSVHTVKCKGEPYQLSFVVYLQEIVIQFTHFNQDIFYSTENENVLCMVM
jgi:hypothetical protein